MLCLLQPSEQQTSRNCQSMLCFMKESRMLESQKPYTAEALVI